MSEILLQAIVEKLEALEIALLKQGSASKIEELEAAVRSIQSVVIKLSSAFNVNKEKIDGIDEDIRALRRLHNKVKHTHYFHKQIWISVSLFIICLLLAYGWVNCNNEKKSFEANDMKYRFWKANGNTNLLKIVFYTDSLYNLDEDQFTDKVLRAERKLEEQNKVQRLAPEKKNYKK